jgi:hypothetical protein
MVSITPIASQKARMGKTGRTGGFDAGDETRDAVVMRTRDEWLTVFAQVLGRKERERD